MSIVSILLAALFLVLYTVYRLFLIKQFCRIKCAVMLFLLNRMVSIWCLATRRRSTASVWHWNTTIQGQCLFVVHIYTSKCTWQDLLMWCFFEKNWWYGFKLTRKVLVWHTVLYCLTFRRGTEWHELIVEGHYSASLMTSPFLPDQSSAWNIDLFIDWCIYLFSWNVLSHW